MAWRKIMHPSCGNTMHSHKSVFNIIAIDTIVVFGAKRMRNIMLVYSGYCKIASKCASLGSHEQQMAVTSEKSEW